MKAFVGCFLFYEWRIRHKETVGKTAGLKAQVASRLIIE
jgi:hypothetical protein